MFKIVTCTWDAGVSLIETLYSVAAQENQDWEIIIVDDGSDSAQQRFIWDWCCERWEDGDKRWIATFRDEQMYGPYNQYHGVRDLNPQLGDIVVFLDGDGDRLANPYVLDIVKAAYDDGALVTYGSLQTRSGAVITGSTDFPEDVILSCDYRRHNRDNGTCFNHLRTVSWDILKQIPEWNFKWNDGTWFKAGTDYVVMIPALEIANGRFKHIKETTLLYNDNQPHPDYLHHGEETARCTMEMLNRPNIRDVLSAL